MASKVKSKDEIIVELRYLFDICRENMKSGMSESAVHALESDVISLVEEL